MRTFIFAPMIPDPGKIKSFRSAAAFEKWLKANHARETQVWLKVHKKGSGLRQVDAARADGRWYAAYPIRKTL